MNAAKIVIAVLLLFLLPLIFIYAPGIGVFLLVAAASAVFRKGPDNRLAIAEWLIKSGKARGQQQRDPHADFHTIPEPGERETKTYPADSTRHSATVDLYSYTRDDPDMYCGSTGLDPWELRQEKSPWELPKERTPWDC